jgi:hypothetical protein
MASLKCMSLVAIAFVVGVGCATLKGASARHQYIEQEAQGFVFNKPASDVWPPARELLFKMGYEMKNTGEATTAESEWKREDDRRTRYLVQVTPVDAGHCKVQFTKMTAYSKASGTDSERDVGTEWELIQKVEPERATAIKTEADKRGEAAKKAAS